MVVFHSHCWGQGRQCRSKSNTLCNEEHAYMRKQDAHKEREREREREREISTKKKLYSRRQQRTTATTMFTKGYKVTLYSDSLRATAPLCYLHKWPELGLSKGTVWIRPLYTCIRHIGQLRISSHQLEIENGHTNRVPREERLCRLCHIEIEDEYHFMCKCPIYIEIRAKYKNILGPSPNY